MLDGLSALSPLAVNTMSSSLKVSYLGLYYYFVVVSNGLSFFKLNLTLPGLLQEILWRSKDKGASFCNVIAWFGKI